MARLRWERPSPLGPGVDRCYRPRGARSRREAAKRIGVRRGRKKAKSKALIQDPRVYRSTESGGSSREARLARIGSANTTRSDHQETTELPPWRSLRPGDFVVAGVEKGSMAL